MSPAELAMWNAKRPADGTAGPFFGRHEELSELLRGFEDASAGRGSLYLIGGEPGIGKSRLADELAGHGRAQGAMVLWGKCWEAGGAPAYWPWVQCLRTYLRTHDPDTVREQLGQGAGDIAQMLPEIGALVPDLQPPPSVDPESARFRLFDSTATFLRNAGEAGTMMLVIDDLHAADTASLLLLRFLAGQLTEMRVLLVGTYRDVELTPDHHLAASITDLAREPATHHLMLTGLSEPDVALLIERTSGVIPSAELASTVHRQTKGNPLFVSEAIRLLATETGLVQSVEATTLRFTIPEAVREVILRRLAQLSEAGGHTITLASVLGPEIPIEALRRLSPLSVEEFTQAMDEVAASGLLVEVGGGIGRFRFSHDLVREVLYEEIPPGRRTRLHLEVAGVLEHLYKADLDRHLAVIAHHYFEGAPAGAAAKAVEYAQRAAGHAAGQLAYEEAVRHYRIALQALELSGPGDDHDRAELLLALGDAQARSGDLPGARDTFLHGFDIARRMGGARQVGQAALGYGGRFVWARAGDDPHLIPMLQDALVLLGGSDDHMRVRLLARLACALRDSPDREHSASLSRQAVDLARELGDPETLARALDGRVFSIWWPENPEERLKIAAELLGLAAEIDDGELMVEGHMATWEAHLELGAMGEARAAMEKIARSAKELRQPAQRWVGENARAISLLLEGRFEEVEDVIVQTLRGDEPTAVRDKESAARFKMFLIRREQGRVGETEGLMRDSVNEFFWYPLFRPALACLLAELGRNTEAGAVFEELARSDFSIFNRDNEWLLGISLAAEACWLLGYAHTAPVLYELLLPFQGRHAVGLAEGSIGALDRYLGLLAVVMGRLDDAERHLGDAMAINDQMGARPWAAHCRHDLAVVLLSRDAPGDRERAEKLLWEAVATAEEIGMVALEMKVRRLLGDGEERAAALADGIAQGVFRREGEYWSVAFEGGAIRLRDSKGLRHLARLLAAPGREFHVLDLVRMEEGQSVPAGFVEERVGDDGPRNAGAILDSRAKAAYRRRLEDLEEELEEAERWHDSERAARAREEMQFLAQELAGAVGLGGRDRRAASAAERARLNVTRAIRAAMARIAKNHPHLGRHLEGAIKTGLYCSYTPDTRAPLNWNL